MGHALRPALQMISDARRIPPSTTPPHHRWRTPTPCTNPTSSSTATPHPPAAPTSSSPAKNLASPLLLEVLLNTRAPNESLRSAFFRAKAAGRARRNPRPRLPPRRPRRATAEELVDTGIQQLLGNLDELPHPVLGYKLLEAPSRSSLLASQPLRPRPRPQNIPPSPPLILTFGCKFNCPYCPIPAYNQRRQHRLKSGERIADEMWQLYKNYGLRYFFGRRRQLLQLQTPHPRNRRSTRLEC